MGTYRYKQRMKSPLRDTRWGPDPTIRPLVNFKHLTGVKPIPTDKQDYRKRPVCDVWT